MKNMFTLLLALAFISFGNSSFAKTIKQTITISGNCGSCKERIEEAAYSVKGVKKAVWNKNTKELKLVFNDEKTNIKSIETAIANAGHDTKSVIAPLAIYKKLPGCCAYRERSCEDH